MCLILKILISLQGRKKKAFEVIMKLFLQIISAASEEFLVSFAMFSVHFHDDRKLLRSNKRQLIRPKTRSNGWSLPKIFHFNSKFEHVFVRFGQLNLLNLLSEIKTDFNFSCFVASVEVSRQ